MTEPLLNVLIAYPYVDKDARELFASSPGLRVLLDSGAFTAWKAGSEVKLDEYCSFLEGLPFEPWRYFTLDVIGDAARSKANYLAMLERGLRPVPIFTRGEDLAEIDAYYQTSDMIGVGGLVRTRGNRGFVKGVMRTIGKRDVHWLGFAVPSFMHYYRPLSCDSSSWSRSTRYGLLDIYLDRGRWLNVTKKDFATRPKQSVIDALERIYDFDARRLARKEAWVNSGQGLAAVEQITYLSWTRYALDVQRSLGTKFFLAAASGIQARLMYNAYRFWRERNFG